MDEVDVVVPRNKVAEFVKFTHEVEESQDIRIKSFGHAGDGNLHIYACSNDMEIGEFKRQVEEFMVDIYNKASEFGGLISGEHGIGYGKMNFLANFSGEVNMRLMRGIKEVFDPKMILNPNKVCYKA